MSTSPWRDHRFDYDAIRRKQLRDENRNEARRLATLIREHPAEFRPALLDFLTKDIVDIVLAVLREAGR
jgi:hypothetical protein